MLKKMMLLSAAVAALLAFAVPVASAAELTGEEGPLGEGDAVTATSNNLTTVTGLGTLSCASVVLSFEVVTNGPEEVDLAPTAEAATNGCALTTESGTLPVTITDGTVLENLVLDNTGAGAVGATFVSDVFGDPGHTVLVGQCHYSGTLNVQAAVNTDVIAVEGGLTSPQCGPGLMTGEFTVEDANGPVVFH